MNRVRHLHVCAVAAVALGVPAASPAVADAAPTCAEGPQTVGSTIYGTPCDDTIRAPRAVTTVFGEGGDDTLFGGRGNDRLHGGEGNDRLYGGIGDDRPRGGPGDDLISGGFGADSLDGETGNDFVRGDATIDSIADTGGGVDTLSYATGATPGFFNKATYPDFSAYDRFPLAEEGRGAYVNLQTGKGDNGLAPDGGGVDEEVEGASFETVIGTAFPDYFVGTSDPETFYGGGGADVILGEGGADVAYGGADGDSCEAATTFECETAAEEVEPRDPAAISAGFMAPQAAHAPALYLTGSNARDVVTATYSVGAVTFTRGVGSVGAFDTDPSAAGGCSSPTSTQVVCPLAAAPDSIVLAGLDADDVLSASGFPMTTSVVVLGGEGNDNLTGGDTEDAVVDGDGADSVSAGAGDDAVPNNEGDDDLHAGPGEDLFISDSVCEADLIDGGEDRDNANWANFDFAISIDMAAKSAGLVGPGGQPQCPPGLLSSLGGVEDIEGTGLADTLIGDSGPNQILGRLGADTYLAAAGDDSILANSGDADPTIDCGEGFDTVQVDHPVHGDAAPIGCESIHVRDPNSFRPPDTPPDPTPPVAEPAPVAPSATPPVRKRAQPGTADRTPPQTFLRRRPGRTLFLTSSTRRVAFAFGASEPRARFRCKLDRAPYRACRSPRTYRLRPGLHTVRIFAIDAAGNRDRSPLSVRVRLRR